jgi:hypothetical protein
LHGPQLLFVEGKGRYLTLGRGIIAAQLKDGTVSASHPDNDWPNRRRFQAALLSALGNFSGSTHRQPHCCRCFIR